MSRDVTVRERTEEWERARLSSWAAIASETKGRDHREDPDRLRTAFQVDRDRLIGSHAFARLQAASQDRVPLARGGRSRSEHSLAVSTLARTIARGLRLNEDLVEAIALGSELGQPPFGPAGEEALAVFTDPPFAHHEQALRVVERLASLPEPASDRRRGLNLTWETRDGILHHRWHGLPPATLEGQVVRLAARVATAVTATDAALEAGYVDAGDLPAEVRSVLGTGRNRQLGAAATDIIERSADGPEARASDDVIRACDALATTLKARLQAGRSIRGEHDRAVHCLRGIAVFHLENPGELPGGHDGEPDEVRATDYVAALTDEGARRRYKTLFLPSVKGDR